MDAEQKKKEGLHQAVRKQIVTSIVTALGLVVGLAWNDAISTSISDLLPIGHSSAIGKLIYAVILTIIVVIAMQRLSALIETDEEKEK